jgi:protein SCO1/2
MGRLRGYLLAAFAETGLPAAALPYVIESLETGHVAYEIAGAAVGLRGLDTPSADVVASLLRAIDNLDGADATVSFESYRPAWPYARPTTALTEVIRTIGHFGARAEAARSRLEVLEQQRERFPGPVRQEMRRVLEAAGDEHRDHGCEAGCRCGSGGCAPAAAPGSDHSCCAGMAAPGQDHDATRAELEDQDGRSETFADFFRGKPSVVAFFYTRCDNPYKCSLTITKLAALQSSLAGRGLAGAVKVTAITYDPDFDRPNRLRLYGNDRGIRFGEDARFFRVTAGFPEIRQRFDLGVNYGTSTVNRHQTEVHVLDERGEIAASFTRSVWTVEAVLTAVERLSVETADRPPAPAGG